jgi:hypothetical protein
VGEMGSMKEMEMALADPAQARVSATTANGRSTRGLIVVASVIGTLKRKYDQYRHFLCQDRISIFAGSWRHGL